MIIEDYKTIDGKGALKASFSIVDSFCGESVKISDCLYFEQNGECWFSFPSRIVAKEGEKSKYYPYVRATEQEATSRLKARVCAALPQKPIPF